ncbi:hypothetical protein FVEN_g11577 [Fusarium venenatum]|uniref:Uncharacterized protein n=1 Tax=Fusarium venenatum TaxID=56646 RepID=A0A2L2TTS0_9HYPO|nr:uncharacterized protein FVRRES_03958 [Fusarium venenatum]KAG8350251.1 hypothetical protein FVEN_g11577 [Fusarium venenatum]CEI67446.1 unnamed protein product [Fusarium venenatum]
MASNHSETDENGMQIPLQKDLKQDKRLNSREEDMTPEFREMPKGLRDADIDDKLENDEDAARFLTLMEGEHIRAHDWEPIRKVLQDESSSKLDLTMRVHELFSSLIGDIIKAGRPFWSSESPSEHFNYEAMSSAPYHVARMLGLFNAEDKRDALYVWSELKDQIPKEEHKIWHAIDIFSSAYRNPLEAD